MKRKLRAKMNKKMTFEAAVKRLSEVVDLLEKSDTPLEESMKLFEEGSELAAFCYHKLSEAEQKIKTITEKEELTDGQN
jgi:exodeoxyribonuclease VII small subunit